MKPSQVKGVNTEAFVNQQKVAIQVHDNSVLGYRGLVGEFLFILFLIQFYLRINKKNCLFNKNKKPNPLFCLSEDNNKLQILQRFHPHR